MGEGTVPKRRGITISIQQVGIYVSKQDMPKAVNDVNDIDEPRDRDSAMKEGCGHASRWAGGVRMVDVGSTTVQVCDQ